MLTQYFAIKQHMIQDWDKTGRRIPLTLLAGSPLTVTQVKTKAKEGYSAVQVAINVKAPKKTTKPLSNHLKKSNLKTAQYLREIPIDESESSDLKPGTQITVDQIFQVGDQISATGISKGKGFAGVIKRWGFAGGSRTHGQSDRERAPGSIGQGTTPGRVYKGKKMPGRFGNQQFTIKNLLIAKIDPQSHSIWIKGSVPGAIGQLITLNKTGTTKFPGLTGSSTIATNQEQDSSDSQDTHLDESLKS